MKKKLTVLIADEMEHGRACYKETLEEEYQVVEAEDGAKAVEILYQCHIDIALLDLTLKKMNGTEVLKRMKTDPRLAKIPVLVKTAPAPKAVEKILALGADDFIIKPCSPAVIRNRVDSTVQKRMLENRIRQNHVKGRFRTESERDVMIAGVTNELRHPLDLILKTAELCEEEMDNSFQVRQAVSDIRRQAKYALSLLKDISGPVYENENADGVLDPEQTRAVRDGIKNISSMEALIIDDDQISCHYHAQMFSRLGITCRLSEHSRDAVRLIETLYADGGAIDICIVNWQTEQKSGAGIVQKVRSLLGKNTIIVVSSGYEEEPEESEMLSSGADYVLKKPLYQSTIYRLATQICQMSAGI